MTSIVTQVILLREFLSVFYGNELVIGIILANWMVLTGVGSFVGRFSVRMRSGNSLIVVSLCLIAVLPSATVFFLRYLRNIVFVPGSMVGILQILYSSFLLMAPYCVLGGLLFTVLVHVISGRYRSNLIPVVYSLEAVGSIIGGFLFNLVMIYFLKTFQSLFFLMIVDFAVAFVLAFRHENSVYRYAVLSISVVCVALFVLFNVDDWTKGLLFKDQDVLYYKDTPYGVLTVTKQSDQKNFYENNILLFSTNDVMQNEEAVHYAMVQHPHPGSVLLISGGIAGTTLEILKYNVDRIDYVELNPWILEIGKKYTSALTDRRIHIVNEDARLYVKRTAERYDVVLINLPDPTTAQINRFFTIEFFQELKKRLNDSAVVSLALLPAGEYVSGEAGQINSIMVNTLKTQFRNILIVPGMKNYFLASDGSLDIHIGRMISRRGIENMYVNQYYLDDRMLEQRSAYITAGLSAGTPLNTDFAPVCYYRLLLHWLSYFRFNAWIPGAVFLIVLVLIGFKLNPVTFGIFTGGFAASSIEVLVLIVFQIVYGYVYQVVGLIVTIFMAGLAAGSFLCRKMDGASGVRNYSRIQFGIGMYSLFMPAFFFLLKVAAINSILLQTVFYLLTFAIAVLIGMEFAVASLLRQGKTASVASELYSVDLAGSAIGALVMAAFLIPLLGVIWVSVVVGLLSFASGVIFLVNGKNYLIAYA